MSYSSWKAGIGKYFLGLRWNVHKVVQRFLLLKETMRNAVLIRGAQDV